MANDEPTCIIKMLDDFRAGTSSSAFFPGITNDFKQNSKNDRLSLKNARKLDFDETLDKSADKKFKQSFDDTLDSSHNSLLASPWEARRVKRDLEDAKLEIIRLEESLNKMLALKAETELYYEKEKKSLEQNLKKEKNTVRDLEMHLKTVRKREAELLDQLTNCTGDSNEERHTSNQKILSLMKENTALKQKLVQLKSETHSQRDRENNEKQLNARIEALQIRITHYEGIVEELNCKLNDKTTALKTLEQENLCMQLDKKQIQDLIAEKESYKDKASYVETQYKKLLQFSSMEKEIVELRDENKKLKMAVGFTVRQENEIEDLKHRISQVDRLENELLRLQSANESLRSNADQWIDLVKHYCRPEEVENKPPVICLKRFIDEKLQNELISVEERTQLKERNEYLNEHCGDLERQVREIEELKSCHRENIDIIARLKKNLALVTKERNMLRQLIDSCEKDVTIIANDSKFDALQLAIEDYKKMTQQIENDPRLCSSDTNFEERYNNLMTKYNELFTEKEILLNKVIVLNGELEFRDQKGEIDLCKTKIVHMKQNPTSEAVGNYEDKLEAAVKEVFILKERVKLLEGGVNQDITRIVEENIQTNSVKEVTELKEKLKSQELQNQRLCQVFKQRSQDFRNTVYSITGYKVDSPANDRYRLTHVYAEDPDDILSFQVKNGKVDMLETPYSRTLRDLADLHLNHHKSLPMFLASLTIQLFNRLTITTTQPILDHIVIEDEDDERVDLNLT